MIETATKAFRHRARSGLIARSQAMFTVESSKVSGNLAGAYAIFGTMNDEIKIIVICDSSVGRAGENQARKIILIAIRLDILGSLAAFAGQGIR